MKIVIQTKDQPCFQDEERFEIGKYSYGLPQVLGMQYLDKLTIGKFCQIGGNLEFLVEEFMHNPEAATTYPFLDPNIRSLFETKIDPAAVQFEKPRREVHIGNDVWIGEGALIFSGSTIGDGCVLGAHTIVKGNVKPYTKVWGNPKQTAPRFAQFIVDQLLELRWWDWPEENIVKAIPVLMRKPLDISALREVAP